MTNTTTELFDIADDYDDMMAGSTSLTRSHILSARMLDVALALNNAAEYTLANRADALAREILWADVSPAVVWKLHRDVLAALAH